MRSASSTARFVRLLLTAGALAGFPGALRADPIDFFADLFGLDSNHHHRSAAQDTSDPKNGGGTGIHQDQPFALSDSPLTTGDEFGSGDLLPPDDGWILDDGGPRGSGQVPEPATLLLCALGAGAVAAARRSRR